ncbi:MAG: O-antigen ligase family protein [Deltaproteobacteria bacterium]|nr:MAG: O-antigen ligase family protein [Deltaproteobacteria bacterium]
MSPGADLAHVDRRLLCTLQALVLGLPLFLGGRQEWAVTAASAVILLLLGMTLRARRRRGRAPYPPGIAALAGLVALALATTLPLPPAVLRWIAPATARLYSEMLPGWPGAGGWTLWRPLALDPYAAWAALSRFSIGLGAFVVILSYPWRTADRERDARPVVFARLLLTLIAGGVLLACLGLLAELTGNGRILWVTGVPASSERVSGPFVNPNHFAAWLEMVIPAAVACVFVVVGRVRGRLRRAADAARGSGMPPRQAWVSALIVHQRRLWAPLAVCAGLLLMGLAHVASGSRGGRAALLVGLGVAGAGMASSAGRSARRRWAAAAVALALVLAAGLSVALWRAADEVRAAEAIDVSLASRLAVSAAGAAIVRDHPLLGTGLGSWLHAFRPYQAPPVEGGIWDHAHNDYLELAAEGGLAGVAVVLLFAFALVRAAARRPAPSGPAAAPALDRERSAPHAREFELPDWRAALEQPSFLRWGLVGGVAAILVHSLIDFGLRMPANFLSLMVVLALLVLSGPPQPAGGTRALRLLVVLLLAAAVPQVVNSARMLAGASPLSPGDCLAAGDLLLAEQGDGGQPRALALIRRALDRSPASLEAHQALAAALGPGPEAEAALRRALALSPWSGEVRDGLGLQLWARGARTEGAAELEESMFRFPSLASHAYLGPAGPLEARDAGQLIHALDEGDVLGVRLTALEDEVAEAIGRGLDRALREPIAGEERAAIVEDLATLLEVRGRWSEAARALLAEADGGAGSGRRLARAARDYLKAGDRAGAERSLLAALVQSPGRGDLYRTLAVDVYAARGDFPAAESVLHAGEQNALDMLPVYHGVTEVLARRESTRADEATGAALRPRALEDREVVP